jgi:hypothetical protein
MSAKIVCRVSRWHCTKHGRSLSVSPASLADPLRDQTLTTVRFYRDALHVRWPEQSAVYFFWTAAEDYVLSSWIEFALRHDPRHLSLHYDGIRVSLPSGVTAADFASRCSEHIKDRRFWK